MSLKPESESQSAWATAEITLRVLPPPEPMVTPPSAEFAGSPPAGPPAAAEELFTTWYAAWDAPDDIELRIGEDRTLTLRFGEALVGGQPVAVPKTSPLLTIYLQSSRGLQVNGESPRTLSASGGRLLVDELHVGVTALRPGDQAIIASIYPGRDVDGARPIDIPLPLVVAESGLTPAQKPDSTPIPWPQPDLLLYVALRSAAAGAAAAGSQPEQLDVWVTCPALLRASKRYDVMLTRADAAALRENAARHALAVRRGNQPLERLRQFGMALFDQIVPQTNEEGDYKGSLADLLVQACQLAGQASRPFTCLISSDEDVALPWELVLPYTIRNDTDPPFEQQDFLALRFALAQWIGRKGWRLSPGVPLRRFEIAHYSQQPDDPAYWQALLGGESRASTKGSEAGFEVNDRNTDVVGIHLLRYLDRASSGEIQTDRSVDADGDAGERVEDADRVEDATRNRRLSFSSRRPLVTLSLVEETAGSTLALDPIRLEEDYALLFLPAQASAVVGPRWPVAADVDRTFYRVLYDQLYRGRRLGEAVVSARAAAAAAHPLSVDWLAYVLYGHPAAEPYIVMQAAAYSLFEALAANPDGPLEAGKPYSFRASYGVELPPGDRVYFPPENPRVTDPRVVVMADHMDAPRRQPLQNLGDRLETTLQIEMPEDQTSVTFNVWFRDGKRDLDSQIVSFDLNEETR